MEVVITACLALSSSAYLSDDPGGARPNAFERDMRRREVDAATTRDERSSSNIQSIQQHSASERGAKSSMCVEIASQALRTFSLIFILGKNFLLMLSSTCVTACVTRTIGSTCKLLPLPYFQTIYQASIAATRAFLLELVVPIGTKSDP